MFMIKRTLIILFLFNMLFFSNAYAYLDPNAGGIFLQVIIPLVFGISAAITVFWRRVIGRFKNIINRLRGYNQPTKMGDL
jgi:hypothetical protein